MKEAFDDLLGDLEELTMSGVGEKKVENKLKLVEDVVIPVT